MHCNLMADSGLESLSLRTQARKAKDCICAHPQLRQNDESAP